MAILGVEPRTFALLARRSNQLSYTADGCYVWSKSMNKIDRFLHPITIPADEILQHSLFGEFEPLKLPEYSQPIDYVWTATVRVIDVYWSTRVVNISAKIGQY